VTVDPDRDISLCKKPGKIEGSTFLHVNDWMIRLDGTSRVGAIFGQFNERDFVMLRYQLGISLAVEYYVAEDVAGFSRPLEKR